ncbi:helix-turn-helix transcriptional regulator [Glaciibacter psychrotolerans]|uniref:Proteasome accessory factor C n=1 Tax=Glaciibacter psychrotolerans TaxID=670054 RepID=A0A7Z0ED49_9MICO|nr:WYL domain-containing protein [Leifsonia psychrotolerans]NYJ19303.1 proteasome accessory factor C [Leifsonia psychrotolerans]
MSTRGGFGAADKLTFLLSLVPYLTEHDDVSVADVATHFSVGADRVRDAVRLIAMSGIPGETSQYLHGDLFDIQWDEFEQNDRIVLTHLVAIDDAPRLSSREAAALIAGLQYLSALPANADREAIASLMAKLTRGSSGTPSELAVSGAEADLALATIQAAVRHGVQVEFDYLNARGEQVQRRVDALRIESVDNDWYLRGWDHLRQAVRTFRLDRMRAVRETDSNVGQHAADVVVPDRLFEGSDDDVTVLLELPASALALLADYRPEGVEPSPTARSADLIRTRVRVAHFHGLKRLVASMAGIVTVIEPVAARQAVAEWAAAGAASYDDEPLPDRAGH